LDQHALPFGSATSVHGEVPGDAWDSKTSTLCKFNLIGECPDVCLGHQDEICRGSERSVALGSEAPHALADTSPGDRLADGIDDPAAITMGNDARKRHADTKAVASLLHVAGVDARRMNTNPNLSGIGHGIRHLADHKHRVSGALHLVPGCSHLASLGVPLSV